MTVCMLRIIKVLAWDGTKMSWLPDAGIMAMWCMQHHTVRVIPFMWAVWR